MATKASAVLPELREIVTDCLIIKYHHKKRALHQHNGIEMIYVLKGDATHLIRDKNGFERKSVLQEGSFVILDYGSSHAFSSCSNDFLIINFLFRPSLINRKLSEAHSFEEIARHPIIGFDYDMLREPPVNHHFEDEDKKILSIFEKAHAAFNKNIPGRTPLLRCYAMEIMIHAMQRLLVTVPPHGDSNTTIAAICDYIDEHYKEDITLTKICQEKYFSLPYISKKFKRVRGLSFEQYLQQVRVHHACTLLLETDMTIDAIANHVNYSDIASFRRAFKRMTGKSPSVFRRTFTK